MTPPTFSRSVFFAYLGIAVPGILALLLLPSLIHNLGIERFGALTLLLALAFYFGAFDFGVGLAISRYTARMAARGMRTAIQRLVRRALYLQVGIGIVVATLLVGIDHAFGLLKFRDGTTLRVESNAALIYVGIAIPLGLATAVIRCAFEGLGRFGMANILRACSTALILAIPIGVSFWSQRLDIMGLSLLAARIVVFAMFYAVWTSVAPDREKLRRPWRHLRAELRPILLYGGWVTVGVAAGSLISLGLLDRFLIGGLIGTTAVLQYAVPSDVITRCLLLPAAVSSVLIPHLSQYIARGRRDVLRPFTTAGELMAKQAGPLAFLLVLNADILLDTLTSGHAGQTGANILRALALGFYLHAMAHIPYCALHALGQPRMAALRHLLELPGYALAAYLVFSSKLLPYAGVLWLVWAAFDLIYILFLLNRIQPQLSWQSLVGTVPFLFWMLVIVAGLVVTQTRLPVYWTLGLSLACAMYVIAQASLLLRPDHASIS